MFWNNGISHAPSEEFSPVTIHLILPDDKLNKTWNAAKENGATVIADLKEQFWGHVYGKMRDPFGHEWSMGPPASEENKKRLRDESEEPADLPPRKRQRIDETLTETTRPEEDTSDSVFSCRIV